MHPVPVARGLAFHDLASLDLCQDNRLSLPHAVALALALLVVGLEAWRARPVEGKDRGIGAAAPLVDAVHKWGDCCLRARSVADVEEVDVDYAPSWTVGCVSAVLRMCDPAVGADI